MKYFVVKHDLHSLEDFPNFVRRTDLGKHKIPRGFRQPTEGNKWVSYAYETSDSSSDRLSYVTGFYSCVSLAQFGPNPLHILNSQKPNQKKSASEWFIEGVPDGQKLKNKVLVPSIDYFYDKKYYSRNTITEISRKEYARIQKYVWHNRLAAQDIPLLGREPESEQEVLAVFIKAYESLGVSRILKIQQRFPDLEIELVGDSKPRKVELELYAQSHIHHKHPKDKDIAVLCWLNDDPRVKGKKQRVKDGVHKIYELRELIQNNKKIIW